MLKFLVTYRTPIEKYRAKEFFPFIQDPERQLEENTLRMFSVEFSDEEIKKMRNASSQNPFSRPNDQPLKIIEIFLRDRFFDFYEGRQRFTLATVTPLQNEFTEKEVQQALDEAFVNTRGIEPPTHQPYPIL